MPHIEGEEFDVPRPEDIAPEDLVPPTPKRPQQPPLKAREPKERRGLKLGRISIKGWRPPEDVDEAMDQMAGGMTPDAPVGGLTPEQQ